MDVSLQIFKKNGGGFRTLSFVWYGSENKIMVFNNVNNNLICWLPIIFRLWYIYDCLLGSWHTSDGFTFSVFSLLIFMSQWVFALSMSAVRNWGGVGDMVGVGDEDTTTMSMASFWCLYFLLWICFALPFAVSVFGFGDVGLCGALFVVNTYFHIFTVVLV